MQVIKVLSCFFLANLFISDVQSAPPSLEIDIPLYRVLLKPGEWDLDKIQYEASLRDISVETQKIEDKTVCVTAWNCEYGDTYTLRDRLVLAGFNAEIMTEPFAYEKIKDLNLIPLAQFSTFTDLGEYVPKFSNVNTKEINAAFKSLENLPNTKTEYLVDFLSQHISSLLDTEEEGDAEGAFLIGKYYYLRGLSATNKRMESFRRPGFRDQKFERLNSEENCSYLTSLQHFQNCVRLSSEDTSLRELATYHCASALYGIRNLGNQMFRILQTAEYYQAYIDRYPGGIYTKRAAMNIVGLLFELWRLDSSYPIETPLSQAQDILFAEGNANNMGYEELRCALMMIEMFRERGDSTPALEIYNLAFAMIDLEELSESLYSTYAEALEAVSAIYQVNGDSPKAVELIDQILSLCTKDRHFMRGTANSNIERLKQYIANCRMSNE